MEDIKKSLKYQIYMNFFDELISHLPYSLQQYGDADDDLISKWSANECNDNIRKYADRFGKNARPGQEKKDILKMVDYAIRMYYKDITVTKSKELSLLEKIQQESFKLSEELKNEINNFFDDSYPAV